MIGPRVRVPLAKKLPVALLADARQQDRFRGGTADRHSGLLEEIPSPDGLRGGNWWASRDEG